MGAWKAGAETANGDGDDWGNWQANSGESSYKPMGQQAGGAARSSPYGGPDPGHANVFIGSLPEHVTEADLQQMFSACGTVVSCKVLAGRGSGFVRFNSPSEASAAIAVMNGQNGLVVKLANNDAGSGGGGGWGGKAQGKGQAPSAGGGGDNLYIRGLPSPQPEEALLYQIFLDLGLNVVRCKLIPDTRGVGSSCAMVQLANSNEADTAIQQLNGQDKFNTGQQLQVQVANSQGGKGGGKGAGGMQYAQPQQHQQTQQTQQWANPAVPTSAGGKLTVKYAGKENPPVPSDNLFILGLPSPQVDIEVLNSTLASLGLGVKRSRAMPDTRGVGYSAAMVQLASAEEAAACIEALNGQDLSAVLAGQQGSQAPAAGAVRLNVRFAGAEQLPSDNLYINGLPSPAVDKNSLDYLFTSIGLIVVRSRILPDTRGQGNSAAMVQLSSAEDAAAAIEALNGQDVAGLTVDGQAQQQQQPPQQQPQQQYSAPTQFKTAGGSGNGQLLEVKYAGDGMPSDNLYIKGLPSPEVDKETLDSMFTSLGFTVLRSRTMADVRGYGSSTAMVQLASAGEAAAAIQALNGNGPPPAAASPVAAPAPQAAQAATAQPFPAPGSGGKMSVRFAGSARTPSDNLYISGLPASGVDQSTLNNVFASLGFTIQRSKIIPDTRGTGCSQAMIQVGSVEEAQAAITSMDGTASHEFLELAASFAGAEAGAATMDMSGGQAPAAQARPAVQLGAASHQQYGAGTLTVKYAGSDRQASDNLYLLGLPSPQVDQAALENLFASMGVTVRRSKVMPDSRGSGSSAAMIQCGSQEEAAAAIEALNGQQIADLGLGAHSLHGEALQEAAPAAASQKGAPTEAAATPGVLKVTFKSGGKGGDAAADTLYITGLPSPQVEEVAIRQVFTTMGLEVAWCRVIADSQGRGSSAAMVQCTSSEEASAALAALDGLDCASAGFDQAPMATEVVEQAPQAYASAPAAAAAATQAGTLNVRYAGSAQTPSDNLYITGLPSPVVDEGDLNQLFVGLGCTIVRLKTIPDTRGQGHSTAMVQLASQEEAAYAIESLHGVCLGGEEQQAQ